ncbi:MAG: cyclic nucleotide-binding domain-containing protein [Xenococcus sp. (in: cyanobacteria)]
MNNQLVENFIGLKNSTWKLGRLAQLLLIAGTMLVYSVISMATANSLFVSQVGASSLPLEFICIGLCSIPAYIFFSQIVDRYSRPKLLCYALLISIALTLVMRGLLILDASVVYYLLLIFIFFQWDFHNTILYPGLLTDYFTTLEYKEYAPYVGIAQSVGTILGGGLTILLSRYLSTEDLLFCLPIVYAIAIVQLCYLEKSQNILETPTPETPVGIIESFKTFPVLAKRYPLIFFLASSSFLLVIIYISSQFLWLNIYGQEFTTDALTSFFGLMRIVISSVQILVLYVFTRPLLKWLGVARMNVVYPLTTLISLTGFVLNFNLSAAIGLQINGDAFYKSINTPIHQLNFNAIPPEFLGRVRALSDGLLYALGLIVAGVILFFSEHYLSLVQITWFVGSLTVLLLLVRLPMGKFYAQGLEDLIRSNVIDLDDWKNNETPLPITSSAAINELLREGDRAMQIKGLELATHVGKPSQFLPQVEQLLSEGDPQIRQEIINLFAKASDSIALSYFVSLLNQEQIKFKATALEILLTNNYQFSPEQIIELGKEPQQEIRVLARFAHNHQEMPQALIFQEKLTENSAIAIARMISYSKNRNWLPWVEKILDQGSNLVKIKALESLQKITFLGDKTASKIAISQLNNNNPEVRIKALQLLNISRGDGILEFLEPLFNDPDIRVRQQLTNIVAVYGQPGLTFAKKLLASDNSTIVKTAILAIGKSRASFASDILFDYLTPKYQEFNITRQWQQQIPQKDPVWQALVVAIADYQQRLMQEVLYVLSCLGYSRTVKTVMSVINSTNKRNTANAIEVLASIDHRRFILPLMPLLEEKLSPKLPEKNVQLSFQWLRNRGYHILLEALESRDRWLRIGALQPLSLLPTMVIKDDDLLVQSIAQELFPPTQQASIFTNTSMNRLLLLKNVALFKNLSLDELYLIDNVLETQQVFAKQTVFAEGNWGDHLFIIASGNISLVKEINGEQKELEQLSTGQFFGEIALFDDAPRWNGAIAITDCTLLKLEKNRFLSLIAQRPHIIMEICRFLSQKLRETDKYRSEKKFPSMLDQH